MMNWPITAFADEIDGDFHVQISELSRHGLQGLDLRSAFGRNVMALDDHQIKEIRTATEDAGMYIQAIGSPVNKVVASAKTKYSELDNLKRALEIAEVAGTKKVRVFTPEADAQDWELIETWISDQLEIVPEGYMLLHENDARYWGAYPSHAERLFDVFGGPNFRAAFDFANTVLIGYRPLDDWFPWILPHLEVLHIKDAIEKEGKVVPAGEGDGQLADTLYWLHEKGWKGTLTLEPHLELSGERSGFSGSQKFDLAVAALRKLLVQ